MSLTIKGKLNRPKAGVGAPSFTTDRPLYAVSVEDFTENGYPKTDENGVRTISNVELKEGAFAIPMYYTSSTKDYSVENTGEQDAERFLLKVAASHPGDSEEATEFMVNNMGKGFILFAGKCNGKGMKMIGDICNPLYLKPAFVANNDKTGFDVTFEQSTGSQYMHKMYYGDLPMEDTMIKEFPSTAIEILKENYSVVKVQKGTEATEIAISSITKEDGMVTLIGQDTEVSKAGTLNSNVEKAILLKDGLAWKSLKGSSITFKIFNDGSKKYLIETSRN